MSLDFEQLVETFSTRYVSPLRWLKPGFYSIRRKVRRRRQDGKNPSDILKDLRAAWDLVQLEAKIEVESSHTRELLGVWYRGYETNFTRVEKAIGVTRKLLELAGGNPPEKLLHQACFGSFPSAELRQATKRLKESLVAWEEGTDAYSKLLPLARLPFTGLPLNQSRLEDILAWAKEFVPPLEEIVAYLDQIESSLRSRVERPVAGLLADLWGLAKLRELESQMLEEADQLQITYGSHFAGLDTDWDSVLGAIEWARRLREHLRGICTAYCEVQSCRCPSAEWSSSCRVRV